jgi:hypothetical protein
MAGAIAGNLHEGSRSEILADYLFSRWGAVTPVRRQDDYGIDLYCTLTDRVGRREWVEEYFTVQIKSTERPWNFSNLQSVRWLIKYPTPLFLCTVSKKKLRVRIYNVSPRFLVSAFRDHLPESLELTLGKGRKGELVQWENGSRFSLSAPIIEVYIDDMVDDARLQTLRDVFAYWVRIDRENCDRVRQGLPMLRMPASWEVNETPKDKPMAELGRALPMSELLQRGLLRFAEGLQWMGGLQGQRGDLIFALEAALLLDRLQKEHPETFENDPFWRTRVPGQLGQIVLRRLNDASGQGPGGYYYAGLDAVEKMISDHPIVQKYLAGSA